MPNEEFSPVADYKRGMESNVAAWKAEISDIERNPDFGSPYKEFAISQLNNSIALMEDAIVGFDKLTFPIKY
jgi:hypothetical protein